MHMSSEAPSQMGTEENGDPKRHQLHIIRYASNRDGIMLSYKALPYNKTPLSNGLCKQVQDPCSGR